MDSSEPEIGARAVHVTSDAERLSVDLADGRRVSAPLSWFPRLAEASQEQRDRWELVGRGEGVHWPDIDEDLSVAGLLKGNPAPGSSKQAG